MRGQSFFMGNKNIRRYPGEKRLCIITGILLNIAGIILLFIPALQVKGAAILADGWVLFACIILSLIRPLVFNRGFADFVMGIITSIFYCLISWATNAMDIDVIENYRTVICFVLVFSGLSRILAFAQLLDHVAIPLILINGLSEIAAAGLLLFNIPSAGGFFVYWYVGLLMMLSGFSCFSESIKLSRLNSGIL